MNYYRSGVAQGTDATTYTCTTGGAVQYGSASNYFRLNTAITNADIIVGNYVTNCDDMLSGATNYSGYVYLGSNVATCTGTFNACYNYNQAINIPKRVTACNYMFQNATNFNSNVTFLGSNVTNCYGMFWDCPSFNKPITLPESTEQCYMMFRNATAFNQTMVIPASVTNASEMFSNCTSMSRNIYFNGNMAATNRKNCLLGHNTGKKINLFYNGNGNANQYKLFNYICGSTAIEYTAMNSGTGWYNNLYNIYIYNNYTP